MVKIDRMEKDGKAEVWPYLKMGNSAEVKDGQWCIVTGHPGGYQPGRKPVVRFGRVLSSDDDLIVSDCTLVGGDSGGPLLDMHGDVIGIHSRIGGELTANMHVPVNLYRDSWDRLASSEMWGEVPRGSPYIGVQGDPDAKNAKIAFVEPGQPGDRAGIQAGDVIIKFGDEAVEDFSALAALVSDHEPGDHVKVEVKRGEEVLELEIVIGRRR
jgi:serine protease Do